MTKDSEHGNVCDLCGLPVIYNQSNNGEVVGMQITSTLEERGKRYGEFKSHAQITQSIKLAMLASPKWNSLSPSQREALEMIAHKIGRILNGDPNYADSWHDIAGYATLVERELSGKPDPHIDDFCPSA